MSHKFRAWQDNPDRRGDCGQTRDTCNFNGWWAGYWKNRTDTIEHTVSRSIARDAWTEGRKGKNR